MGFLPSRLADPTRSFGQVMHGKVEEGGDRRAWIDWTDWKPIQGTPTDLWPMMS